ncbi:MAG: tRNA (N(6)-L-threonylcarbamoyladenosine(37)-C(2))-methylthiotransferase MtaB [Bacteroidales bacterium]|jgi:threonylcarbamoyladenosine tRNA methylthiotransferase MtaB|nr:tRNA (N(6)-L-threonylcarbamoyladenosine(37)-C(2))-methylthiotransferase MtaB [Bacteroidales bacterium]
MDNKNICIHTLGCKLNFSESATLGRLLKEKGHTITTQNAHIHIINTCAVTEVAEKKSKYLVHKIKNQNPNAKILLMGCYATLESVQKIENEVDIIFVNKDKLSIVEQIDTIFDEQKKSKIRTNLSRNATFFSSYSLKERTRSFLKIQDGCDYHCTYCTVAKARGESRSDEIENVVKNAQIIVNQSIAEIILTGVNIGDFRTKKGENFYDLLVALGKISLLKRLRISSIEPNLLTNEIIDLVANSEQILPHFHIPLQSGCDAILQKMKRRYNVQLFADKVLYIKEKMPNACIAADVICGFPTETEEQFKETYNFINSLPISMLHVFPYSLRPDTPAAEMEGHIPNTVKQKRAQKLLELSGQKKKFFYDQHQGKILNGLIENKNKNGYLTGLTDNYIRFQIPYNKLIINQIVKIQLTELDQNGVYFCQLIENH